MSTCTEAVAATRAADSFCGCVHSPSFELENTVRRLNTSGTMTAAVPADARMPIIRLEWSAMAP
jgi:hypothetical protein